MRAVLTSSRLLPASCAGLVVALVAVAPAQARGRVSKGVRPAAAQVLAERNGLRPEDNVLSLQLKRNGPPTLQTLRAKAGRDFDQAMLRDTVRPLAADPLQRAMAIHTQMTGAPAPVSGR